MDNLVIAATKYTPKINLDAESGTMSISGKSYPENTFEFYKPVMEWVNSYFAESAQPTTKINVELIYFNSSSSKLFFDFFDIVQQAAATNNIEINWIYDAENESALEAGEDFQEDFEDLNFSLVTK
jgi:hypothetical protein